jgi:hypothetical protein
LSRVAIAAVKLCFLKASVLMGGVDFVIKALFETFGLRCEGDCAGAGAIEKNTKTMKKRVADFTGAMVLLDAQPAKHIE